MVGAEAEAVIKFDYHVGDASAHDFLSAQPAKDGNDRA